MVFFASTSLNANPPSFTLPNLPLVFCDTTDNCTGNIDLVISATNDCPSGVISFGYALSLDYDGDGVMDTIINDTTPGAYPITTTASGSTTIANIHIDAIPYGNHKIKWFAHDDCDQSSDTEYFFEVKDCKKPTILVNNGIEVNMFSNTIIIWPGDPATCNLPDPNICA